MSKPSGLNMSVNVPILTVELIDTLSKKSNMKKNHFVRTCLTKSLVYQHRYRNNYVDNPVTNQVRPWVTELDQTEHKVRGYYLKYDMVKDIEDIANKVDRPKTEVFRHFLMYGIHLFAKEHSKELGLNY